MEIKKKVVFIPPGKVKSNASLTGVEVVGEESTSTIIFPTIISWGLQMKMAPQSTEETNRAQKAYLL